jgi:hypothetical protein
LGVPKNLKTIACTIDAYVLRLRGEIDGLQRGDVRHAARIRNGAWQDRTAEAIHDKRNLVATLEALLAMMRQP